VKYGKELKPGVEHLGLRGSGRSIRNGFTGQTGPVGHFPRIERSYAINHKHDVMVVVMIEKSFRRLKKMVDNPRDEVYYLMK
jgi:hypothetical protein